MSVDPAASALPTAPPVTVTASAPIKAFSEGGDGPTFKDVIDIINPLQHIPVINTIYRHLTGDEEGAVADVGGGALWAGPIGLVGSLVDLAVKAESGKTIGDNILSWLGLDDDDAPSEATKTAETQAQQQVQQQQAQQTAAATAPLPAIAAQALAPQPKRGDDRKDGDKDGKSAPAKVGDYLVFGATASAAGGSSQPESLLPVQSADATDPDASNGPSRQGGYMVFGGAAAQQQQTPAAVTVSATSTASSADQSNVGHPGDYMVFGVPVPATPATRPVQIAQATPAAAPAPAPAPAPVTVQAPAAAATPAGLSPLPSRTFAVPERRSQVTPNALPMPTTGPAAVPGHVAQTQAMPATMNQDNTNWFAQAMSANLDKYAAAQKLADQSTANSASAVAGAQASADTFATIH